MPQMAPLNWLPLMMSFIMILMTINCLNYFSISYLPIKTNITLKKTTTNWKW